MKKTILLLVLLLPSFYANGQGFRLKKDEMQIVELKIEDTVFVALVDYRGMYRYEGVSPSNVRYPVYLGYKTTNTFNKKTVFTDKNKKEYWVLGLTKSGYPKKIPIEMKEIKVFCYKK